MADNAGDHRSGEEEGNGEAPIREQDRLLPIANVGRLMKQILPPNAKISKDAKETMQESVSEFVAFVTAEASDKCRRERRKTVNGDDVCWALASLGFDSYSVSLRRFLQRYRDLEGDRAAKAGQQDLEGVDGDDTEQPPQQLRQGPGGGGGVLVGFGGVVERGGSSDSRQEF